MKKHNFVTSVMAAASALFVLGAVTQKSQIKDLGLGAIVAMGIAKQHNTDKKLNNCAESHSVTWQQSILSEVINLSRSLEKVEEKIAKPVDLSFHNQNLEQVTKLVQKLEQRLDNQEKQQNKIRSSVDKLKYKLNTKKENEQRSQSSKKNFNCLSKHTKITAQLIAEQPTTYVYIDGNNFKCATHRLNMIVNYQTLKSYFVAHYGKVKVNFYDGVCSSSRDKQNCFHSHLRHLGYNVVTLPKKIHQDGTGKTCGDDILMAINILEQVKSGDHLILISGDGDFFPVIEKIQERQVKVTAISSIVSVSDLILNKADEFICLEKLFKLIATDDNFAA